MHKRLTTCFAGSACALITFSTTAFAGGNCTTNPIDGSVQCDASKPALSKPNKNSNNPPAGPFDVNQGASQPISEADKAWALMWKHYCANNPDAAECKSKPGGSSAAPVQVSAAELAQQAMSKLQLPLPQGSVSPEQKLPDGRLTTFVQIPTWFQVDAAQWKPVRTRAQAGPVFAEATATPVSLSFTPGNSESAASCEGPGSEWSPVRNTAHDREPGGCDTILRKSSFGLPGGMAPAQITVTWHVTWKGSGGTGGDLGTLTRTTQFQLAIAEAQAVIQ